MIKRITNNLGWKLLSVVLAFLVWLIVVISEDPIITRTFDDIVVQKTNVSAITSEKKAIEYLEGETISVIVRGKRTVVENMTYEDILAVADLEKKSITGAIDIEVNVPGDVTVYDKEPAMMMVELENIVTVQKEIQYYMEGEPAEGFIYLDPIITPNNIEIEGPESKVGLIRSVLVPVNIDGATKDVTLFRAPQISDESNNVIKGLTPSSNQAEIQVPIQKTKVIPIELEIGTVVAQGYELIDAYLSQETLSIRGEASLIDSIEKVSIDSIGLSSYSENVVIPLQVGRFLPAGLSVYEDVTQIQLTLEIEPIVEKTIEVTHNDITVRNIPNGMQFKFVDELTYQISFRGIASKLEDIDVERISPAIMLLGLEEGVHEVALSFYEPFGADLISEPPTVVIELLPEPEEEFENPDDPDNPDGGEGDSGNGDTGDGNTENP